MSPIVLGLPGDGPRAAALAARLGARAGTLVVRRFPDGETYVRIDEPVDGGDVVLVCTLERPDERLVALLLTAATARDLGARRVGLVAPYLPYMRQDARFRPGEGVTSRYVAALLARTVDWLVTVDPHLHRHRTLAELYAIPAVALTAAPLLGTWIAAEVRSPVLIGPDAESAPWVEAAARTAGAPWMVCEKRRHDDRHVDVAAPARGEVGSRTPVVVDDVIATGGTMRTLVAQLRALGTPPPVCVAVHAVLADGAEAALATAGAARLVTTNTIAHASNAIDVTPLLAAGVRDVLAVP